MIEEQIMHQIPGIIKDDLACLKQGTDLIAPSTLAHRRKLSG
jgi:hypothetical protein